MNEKPTEPSLRRSLLMRLAFIATAALINFAITFATVAITSGPNESHPPPPISRLLLLSLLPVISWVVLSIPVQFATRRLVGVRLPIAVLTHVVTLAFFQIAHSVLFMTSMEMTGLSNPRIPLTDSIQRYAVASLPSSLLVYAAIVAGTLAWDNWQLFRHREQTATRLAAELTRAELSALRSKMQPHFLFNALHGISSVMHTDVPRARQMMVALSHLLRSSLHAGSDRATVEQEVQFARDYLDLQHMRFEHRLVYDVDVGARPRTVIPAFILQPLVENAVIHGMADRFEPTKVTVAVRELDGSVEIDVSDNGPGFAPGILEGRKSLGVGLGALRARLHALPNESGMMTLRNRPDGGAQVTVRVPILDENGSHA